MRFLQWLLYAALAGAIDGFFGWLLLDHMVHIGYLNWWAICAFTIELVGTSVYYLKNQTK